MAEDVSAKIDASSSWMIASFESGVSRGATARQWLKTPFNDRARQRRSLELDADGNHQGRWLGSFPITAAYQGQTRYP
jgi:hypothetical protein